MSDTNNYKCEYCGKNMDLICEENYGNYKHYSCEDDTCGGQLIIEEGHEWEYYKEIN